MNVRTDDPFVALFRQTQDRLPGHNVTWLKRRRDAALAYFAEVGLPTVRQEAWKYTDVRPIARKSFALPLTAPSLSRDALAPFAFGELDVYRLVFVDGRLSAALSSLEGLPTGITVMGLAHLLESDPAAVATLFGAETNPDLAEADGFRALNTLFFTDGACVRLTRGVALDKPLHLLYLATGQAIDGQSAMMHLHTLILAEANTEATIIEQYAALNEAPYLTNTVTKIVLEANAVLEHYTLEQESDQAYHVADIHIRQDRDSRYTSHNVALGGRLVRNDLHALLDAPGSKCVLNGLTVIRGRQHVDHHTRIDHQKPHGTSREWYKGVLDDQARSVFSGRVVVHKDAQHTDAAQTNNNLLLSDNAEADTQPQLEIYADDVKCSHGATVGQLDRDALFYLRSRAIDEPLARSLLIYAFANDVLTPMRVGAVRRHLEDQLNRRLLASLSIEEPA